MIRRIALVSISIAALLFAAGCDLFGSDSDSFTAPDMGSPADLQASGGTVPASETAALSLFTDSLDQMNTEVGGYSPNIAAAQNARTMTTETYDETIPVGGGTVSIKGSATANSENNLPDAPKPNTTYNNALTTRVEQVMDMTITNVVVPEVGTPTYTVNGKAKLNTEFDMNMDCKTDGSNNLASIDMDLYVGLREGYAYSVRRSDGAGAKFIISYAFEYSKNDISLEALVSTDMTDLTTKLSNTMASLKVYNDANEEVYSIEVPLSELSSLEI